MNPLMSGVLVIIPCGQNKIWNKTPEAGPTSAKDAYRGPPFGINRAFAEKFGDTWMILSAKYGLMEPDFEIPGSYNVTFKDRRTGPITTDQLRDQVRLRNLDRFRTVIGLGGKEYCQAIELAFAGMPAQLHFPFCGLPIGKAMQATKKAIAANDPLGVALVGHPSQSATSAGEPRIVPANEPRLVVDAQPGTAQEVCHSLHQWLNEHPVFDFPYPKAKVPRNGIYVLFEEGEGAHGTCRIVRIGTHTGDNQLRSRLTQHFLHEKKDRSIFRKNIGRCLLNRNNDPFLESWELDLTTRKAREMHRDAIDLEKQKDIERRVSEYIRRHFRFVVLEIPDKATRLELESKITSTVSLCKDCGPSVTWLGRHSPLAKIQQSGLWQVNELYKTPLSVLELQDLLQITGTR